MPSHPSQAPTGSEARAGAPDTAGPRNGPTSADGPGPGPGPGPAADRESGNGPEPRTGPGSADGPGPGPAEGSTSINSPGPRNARGTGGAPAPGESPGPGDSTAPSGSTAPGDDAVRAPRGARSDPGAARPDSGAQTSPSLDFAGTTPYEDYVQEEVLTHLQHPVSDDPGEMAFLVTTQVMELWFTVIVHEWETAAAALGKDDLSSALAALRRSAHELEALNASWKPLARLTPAQFNAYRGALGEASGFQSAMYRRLEFLLGDKSASLLVPHRGAPRVHDELLAALREPSLYDQVLRFLARRGQDIPSRVLNRDVTQRHRSDPAVERVWQRIYSGDQDGDLVRLGEALTDVAELMWRWRHDHLVATRRAMGAKAGTGGSSGVAWLEKRANQDIFPELWTARSHV